MTDAYKYSKDFQDLSLACLKSVSLVKSTATCAACNNSNQTAFTTEIKSKSVNLTNMMTNCSRMQDYESTLKTLMNKLLTYAKAVGGSNEKLDTVLAEVNALQVGPNEDCTKSSTRRLQSVVAPASTSSTSSSSGASKPFILPPDETTTGTPSSTTSGTTKTDTTKTDTKPVTPAEMTWTWYKVTGMTKSMKINAVADCLATTSMMRLNSLIFGDFMNEYKAANSTWFTALYMAFTTLGNENAIKSYKAFKGTNLVFSDTLKSKTPSTKTSTDASSTATKSRRLQSTVTPASTSSTSSSSTPSKPFILPPDSPSTAPSTPTTPTTPTVTPASERLVLDTNGVDLDNTMYTNTGMVPVTALAGDGQEASASNLIRVASGFLFIIMLMFN